MDCPGTVAAVRSRWALEPSPSGPPGPRRRRRLAPLIIALSALALVLLVVLTVVTVRVLGGWTVHRTVEVNGMGLLVSIRVPSSWDVDTSAPVGATDPTSDLQIRTT